MARRIFLILAINIVSINLFFSVVTKSGLSPFMILFGFALFAFFISMNIAPMQNRNPVKRLYILLSGCELLRLFLITLVCTTIIQGSVAIYLFMKAESITKLQFAWLLSGVGFAVFCESIIFWNGIVRVYLTSIQLGIKHRVLGVLFGSVAILNIYYLTKIINICENEVEFEIGKMEINNVRIESEICGTKYPILLVHGLFFRDFKHISYWGRISKELQKNGATLFYGRQQSAGTIEENGKELAQKIEEIIKENNCEKVNIIAHSKGGLDCRSAISQFGADKYVATLTTISTPHYGCEFAEYLVHKIPKVVLDGIAKSYNATLKRFGETSPDFIGSLTDMTASRCKQLNELMPDCEGVVYESVMSYCNKAQSGKFPLNLSYYIVKMFDGKNDGLVSVDSAKWGTSFTLIEPRGKRGISHGDVIDLNRENIADFDVREFYVGLVSSLKNRGY